MARIYYSALVAGIRGRINGNIFSTSTISGTGVISGANARTHSKLTKADAGRFGQIKRNVTEITTGWPLLGGDIKAAWNAFGAVTPHKNRFGDNTLLSGFQQYIMINQRLKAAGIATIDEPPILADLPSVGLFSTAFDFSASEYFVTPDTTLDVKYKGLVYAAAPRADGRGVRTRNFKYLNKFTIVSGTPYNIFDDYLGLFGTTAVGQAIDLQIFVINTETGQISTPYFVEGLIVA